MENEEFKILVADDDPLMIATLEQLLKREGFNVDTATDGYKAVEHAKVKQYDFVICDVKMPGMDGIETLRLIKKLQPEVRSIIITGFASEKAPVDAIKIGVDDYIYKPFELDEFLHIIRRNLKNLKLQRDNERMHQRTLEMNEELRMRLHDLQAAAGVQQFLIPKTIPKLKNLRFGAKYEPFRDGVGGDYYDFITLDDDKLGIVIGDVSGHDLAAALIMTMGRTLIRTNALSFHEPDLVLEKTSESLLQDTASNIYITLFYAVIDLKTRWISFANAGHYLPYFLTDDRGPFLFGRPGFPLGIVPDAHYIVGRYPLGGKGKILFYTDGVIEAANAGREEYSEKHLRSFVAEHRRQDPVTMVEGIFNDVKSFTDGMPFNDDITLLAIEWNLA